MRVSKIGLINQKISNLDSQYPAQDMLIQTGQITRYSSGIYAYGHIPYLVKKNIDQIICDIFNKYEWTEILLPALQPELLWEQSGRLNKYVESGVMLRVQTEKGNFCLAPTAEEAVVSFAKQRLRSYKDLPITFFQISEKFRNEIRPRGFLLRGKAFDMMDAYSFGRNQKDLDIEYNKMKDAFIEVFNTLGLEVFPVIADNGDIGGQRSDEFMFPSPMGEDVVLIDKLTGKAFNSELLEIPNYKNILKKEFGVESFDNFIKKKAVELGHIFQLGESYSKTMAAYYIDKNGTQKNYVMGCYGIGISRALAMVYEKNIIKNHKGKFEGIVLPINLAPYLIHIIPKFDDENKIKQALFAYEKLKSNNVDVLFDDRTDISIGSKIKDSKILGVPYVTVFGKTLDNGIIEVENNLTGEKIKMNLEMFISSLKQLQKQKKFNITLETIIKK